MKMRKDEDRLNGRRKWERVRDASIGVGPNKQSGAYAERTLWLNDNDDNSEIKYGERGLECSREKTHD